MKGGPALVYNGEVMPVTSQQSDASLRQNERPLRLFISYAQQDHSMFQRLEAHLGLLKRQGLVATWHDWQIAPGQNIRQETQRQIDEADAIVLLISADYFASDACFQIHLERALQRQREQKIHILPIIIRPVDWKNAPFKDLPVLPANGVPVASWPDPEAALASITEELRTRFISERPTAGPIDGAPALAPDVPEVFRALIGELTRGFVGRKYVFDAIAAFVGAERSGYFFIKGEPGVGKSAILAEFVSRTGAIVHINNRAQGICTAAEFQKSVCEQLIARYRLPYRTLPDEPIKNGQFLAKLLGQISERLGSRPKDPLIIAVDALDEVDADSETTNVLFLPNRLPNFVYFVITQRPVTLPLSIQAPQCVCDLAKYPSESRLDITAYLSGFLQRPALRAWIDRQRILAEEFVELLAEKSENNFMYLHYVLPDIERGAYTDLRVENLPTGLMNYYDDHWRRMGMTKHPLPRTKIKVVYILAEVRQPVSRSLISDFAKEDEITVQSLLDEWEAFLRCQRSQPPPLYSLYHASFRDFLHRKDIVQAAGVTFQGIHALIADNMWAALFGHD